MKRHDGPAPDLKEQASLNTFQKGFFKLSPMCNIQ